MSDRLLEAAIAQFGAHGLAAANTRAIAAAGGVAMSTITYRHGGKEGLYLAAADHIAAEIGARIHPMLALGGDDPVERAVLIVRRFAILMLSEESAAWSRFIVREQMQPTEAFNRLWEGAMRAVVEALADSIARATGRQDPRAARITALTLMGQALMFRGARASVLRTLDRDVIEPEDAVAILGRLEANVRAVLTAPEDR